LLFTSSIRQYRILLCKKRQRCFNLFCCFRKKEIEDEENAFSVPRDSKTGDRSLPTHGLEDTTEPSEEERRQGLDFVNRGVVADGAQKGVTIEEEEGEEGEKSLEWQVMNSGTTTASIRSKLFQRSISIHPDK